MLTGHRRALRWTSLALGFAAVLGSCAGGGGGNGTFQILAINVNEGAVWRINRPIVIEFSQPIDLSSVNLNTINVRQLGGGPAAGTFYRGRPTDVAGQEDPRVITFQPLCPTLDDASDAGLLAGPDANNNGLPHSYELNVLGVDKSSALPIRAVNGDALALSATRRFTTPVSLDPLDLYVDTKVGPPSPIVRPVGSALEMATYIEVGGVGGARHYFERLPNGTVTLDPPLDLPLNKLSDMGSQIALVIAFDQAVSPRSSNINSTTLRWEFLSTDNVGTSTDVWTPLTTTVSLDENCSRNGSLVRVTPLGMLPPETTMRAVVTTQFSDIVGEVNLIDRNDFAVADTETAPSPLTDNFLEDFDDSANDDANATFAEPHALWDEGELSATFSFTGTGGPGGHFDWYLAPGTVVIFNTSNTTILGGVIDLSSGQPSFLPTGNQTVIGGIVDVEDFYIDTGAVLKIEGPNPFVLLASGDVTIKGSISANGTNSPGVNTLNTTNIPEPGAPGQAGGGKGGTGSPLTTASSPRGGNGFGAFNASDGGGGGGESGWSNTANIDARRGAGGGGGRFGRDVPNPTTGQGTYDQRLIGLDAEPGFDGQETDNGAITGAPGPFGGSIGPSPFVDTDTGNDFYGTRYVEGTGGAADYLVAGELKKPWAGSGGGGGGDASRVISGSWPPPWTIGGDEKGAGGAGGGGSIHVLALGQIVFGPTGTILCRGGIGGGGENTIFLNRVGGGSGGGSGGHVILQSASLIDMRASTATTRAITATGGQGGAGKSDLGGGTQSPNGQRETTPNQDACPTGYSTTGVNPCRGLINGAGGDGGPGLVQLHTSTGVVGTVPGAADILIPSGLTLSDIVKPPPLNPGGAGVDGYMVPTFGRTSRALSKWIALGEGGFDLPTSSYGDVTFEFDGTNPATGRVETDLSGNVLGLTPILGPTALTAGAPNTPYVVVPGGQTIVFDTALLPARYVDNPELLVHFLVELSDPGNPSHFARFDVIAAEIDSVSGDLELTVDVDTDSMTLLDFTASTVLASLQPAYFRVRSNGIADRLPSSASIRIRVEATGPDAFGNPDPTQATGLTTDVSVLSAPPNGNLRFVRFEVLFDVDALQQGLTPTNPIPSLDFFRLPFSYP